MSPVWTMKILAENDFSTVLANGVPFQEASFLQALSDIGSGSVQIPVSSSILAAPLPGVLTTPIIDQEAVYEFYQDGVWRFGFLAEEVTYGMLAEDDTRVHKIEGRGLAASLEWAFALPAGWPTLSTETKRTFVGTSRMHVWYTLFQEAKTAGFIPHITVDFTATADSAGVTWTENDDFEVEVGKDLLALLIEYTSAAGVQWQMGQNFVLSAKQTWGVDRSSTIKLYGGRHQVTHSRSRDRKTIFNDIYVRSNSGTIGHAADSTSQAKWRKRAKWLESSSSAAVTAATLVAATNIAELKNEVDTRTLKVLPNEPGRVVYQDYSPLGDTLSFVTKTETLLQKCVAAAIKLDSSGGLDLELTLQFLVDPLAVRLRRISDRLGAAAVVTRSTSPVNLDDSNVSTIVNDAIDNYTNTSIPGQVVVSSTAPLIYQSNRFNDVRAAVQLVWTQPLNGDLTTISDGDHYEVQWQLSTTYSAPITWDQIASFTWDQLLTWDRPVSFTYADSPQWHSMNVPWDTTTVLIQELMADANYKFRVRAVDTFANFGPWSTVQNVQTIGDRIAPSQPKAPEVATSMIEVQVIHRLGKDGFADYTLEPDLDHLDVHVGSSTAFAPDDTNRVGAIVANAGMLQAQIPAIGSFKVDSLDSVYVKVIAVDRYGNKSGTSLAATATAVLIDDAHINDLTVTKLTAGTLSAAVILSGSIKTSESGARVELDAAGIQVYDILNMKTFDVDATTGDVVMAGTFKTGLTGQRIQIEDSAPYSTMYFYAHDGVRYAFMNAVDYAVGDQNSIGLGINTAHWIAALDDTTELSARLFMLNGVSLEIINASTQAQFGGAVYLTESSAKITSDLTSDPRMLVLDRGNPIQFYGKFINFTDYGANQAIFSGNLFITPAATSITISYGATKAQMTPMYSVRLTAANTHWISAHDNTGFTVTIGSSANFYIFFWCYRV